MWGAILNVLELPFLIKVYAEGNVFENSLFDDILFQKDRKTERQTDKKAESRKTERQTNRKTRRQKAERQKGRKTKGQKDRHFFYKPSIYIIEWGFSNFVVLLFLNLLRMR
jgi:hypothetical protein